MTNMSHSVTIRTTTTTTSSTVIINTGYLKTLPGILKLLQVALGIVCVGISAYYFQAFERYYPKAALFFILMTTTFMIASTILLLSCLASLSTGTIIAKTMYEVLFHSIAFALLLASSLTTLIEVTNYKTYSKLYDALLAAAVMGLVNSALYLISTILALRSYRGI